MAMRISRTARSMRGLSTSRFPGTFSDNPLTLPKKQASPRITISPSINIMRITGREDGSDDLGVEAVLLGELLHGVVHVVRRIVGYVEVGGLRVGVFVGLGADVLVVHAEHIQGVADALDHGLV